jgi:single-strand DNA-binding protein
MSGLNKAMLIGNLGNNPEVRYTRNQKTVCDFSIATSRVWKSNNEKKEATDWHFIRAWGKLGDVCGQYLHKGSKVYIEGRIEYDTYEDKQGNKKYFTRIIADEMKILSPKNGNGKNKPADNQPQEPVTLPKEDIPF